MHKILCLALMVMGTASFGRGPANVAPTSALIEARSVPIIDITKRDSTETSQANKGDDDDPIVPVPTPNPKK